MGKSTWNRQRRCRCGRKPGVSVCRSLPAPRCQRRWARRWVAGWPGRGASRAPPAPPPSPGSSARTSADTCPARRRTAWTSFPCRRPRPPPTSGSRCPYPSSSFSARHLKQRRSTWTEGASKVTTILVRKIAKSELIQDFYFVVTYLQFKLVKAETCKKGWIFNLGCVCSTDTNSNGCIQKAAHYLCAHGLCCQKCGDSLRSKFRTGRSRKKLGLQNHDFSLVHREWHHEIRIVTETVRNFYLAVTVTRR